LYPEQDENAKAAIRKGLTASQAANPWNLESQQRAAPVFNGRPFDYSGPPIGLYHRVFNKFEKGLEADDPIPRETRENVRGFIEVSSAVYEQEDARLEEIEPIFNRLLGRELTATTASKVKSDGICIFVQPFNAYLLMLEVKNEIGTGESDPFVQASFAYQFNYAPDNCLWSGRMLAEYG
jgi:hypothetical protein